MSTDRSITNQFNLHQLQSNRVSTQIEEGIIQRKATPSTVTKYNPQTTNQANPYSKPNASTVLSMDDMNPYERVSITSTDDAAILKQARKPYLYKSTDTVPENNPVGEHPYL